MLYSKEELRLQVKIKVVNQLTLKQEIILDYLGGLKVITKVILNVEEWFRRVSVRIMR